MKVKIALNCTHLKTSVRLCLNDLCQLKDNKSTRNFGLTNNRFYTKHYLYFDFSLIFENVPFEIAILELKLFKSFFCTQATMQT